jgi:hypothetical protein
MIGGTSGKRKIVNGLPQSLDNRFLANNGGKSYFGRTRNSGTRDEAGSAFSAELLGVAELCTTCGTLHAPLLASRLPKVQSLGVDPITQALAIQFPSCLDGFILLTDQNGFS